MEVRVPDGVGGGGAAHCTHRVDTAVCVAHVDTATRLVGRH